MTTHSTLEIRSKEEVVDQLASAAEGFYQRGWAFGTGGNFSALVGRNPLRLLITASGVDKGKLNRTTFVLLNENGQLLEGCGKPSAETDLHYAIYNNTDAGAVLHTHSVWSTVLSQKYLQAGEIRIKGLEMLKGLSGVTTHQHEEVFPVLENSQDIDALSEKVTGLFDKSPGIHAFLLSGHGLTTWGKTIEEARRHVEIIEFLLNVQAHRELIGI
ncbi:MAG: methylthioribulose 1-phosphate dehydratase [Sumerlaeia bacterium]